MNVKNSCKSQLVKRSHCEQKQIDFWALVINSQRWKHRTVLSMIWFHSRSDLEIMDAIRKKMQSLKGETDALYAGWL